MTPARDPKKFDPARAHLLDAPEREAYLPDAELVSMLELSGTETVVDYGAGTGRVAAAVADALPEGRVIAVDESEEMLDHLRANPAAARVEPLLAVANATGLPDACADRVLAVNLLHEVRGETALAEMRRLLAPGGFALVVDWERGRGHDVGPPDDLRYGAEEAAAELAAAGLAPTRLASELPLHFAFRASARQPNPLERRPRRAEPMRVPRPLADDPDLVLVDSTWGTIQPLELAPGVRTVGERELIAHLEAGGRCCDTRPAEAFAASTIPGSVSLPHDRVEAGDEQLAGSEPAVYFCNGPQCSATPRAVTALLAAGHPPEAILYYRGGMHDWITLGLPVQTPGSPGTSA